MASIACSNFFVSLLMKALFVVDCNGQCYFESFFLGFLIEVLLYFKFYNDFIFQNFSFTFHFSNFLFLDLK